jgi:hypothetical protein
VIISKSEEPVFAGLLSVISLLRLAAAEEFLLSFRGL